MTYLSIPFLLQVFCIYHAYKNRKETHWYFIIFFLPVIGGIIYLFTQVFKKHDLDKAQDSITKIINPTKKITDLEQKLKFSDTHDNKVKLADAYFENNDFQKAISHYEESLKGLFSEDEYTLRQLVIAYFKTENYKKAISKGIIATKNNAFKKSDGYYFYGLALAKENQKDKAIAVFKFIDRPFSNYEKRLNYAKYLISLADSNAAKEILQELSNESLQVSKQVKRQNSFTFNDVSKTLSTL